MSEEPQSVASRGCGLVGCVLVIAVLAALGVGVLAVGNALEPLADRFLWTPSDVVREYLAAYDEGNMDRAKRFLCSQQRSRPALNPGAPENVTSFSAYVDDTLPYPRANGQVAIYYAITVPGHSTPARDQALLQREDEGWRICAFTD